MLRIILVLAASVLLIPGCNLGGTEPETVYDTVRVYVRDTIYSDPPALGAPLIQSLSVRQSEGQDGKLHYYIDSEWTEIEGAIGYKVYYSFTRDSAYSVMNTGTFGRTSKRGMFTYLSGTLFFKVAAVDNNGHEGPRSPHAAVIYDGVQ